ncbi:MAG TPA: hypothetical protein VMU62_03735, partial [Acidobacteriaceae bacterium]|nr:hypothetical protein [Acidobacteriaceae bacterium]
MYSSRITHLRMTPKNIDYWDYMILCHGDDAVARVLQRFEYWDGTKAGGNVHGEDLNDQQQATGQDPTQDVSRYVYKTVEELAWELLGSVSERTLPKTLDILCEQLGYLKRRNNPYSTFDHTKQYEFQETLVVAHLARLSAIVDHFLTLGRRLRPVLYAIEQLTRRGVYVAHLTRQADGSFREDESHLRLSIESVAAELRAMHTHLHMDEQAGKKKPTLPRFVRSDLAKDEQHGFCAESDLPQGLASSPGEPSSESPVALPTLHLPTPSSPTSRFSNFAETNPASSTPSIQQIEGNSAAVSPEQRGSFAETIPIITPGMTSLMTAAASGEETAATLPARDAAAPAGFQLESLSPDEIALVLEHRHKAFAQTRPEQASGSESVPEPVATIESQPNALPNGEVAIASPRDTSASPPNADEPPLLPTQAPTNRRTPGPPKPAPAGVPPLSVAP